MTNEREKGIVHGNCKFKSLDELQEKIDKYFKSCTDDKGDNPVMVTGLALALDTTRETLCELGKNPVFADAIKRAKEKVAQAYEKRMVNRGNSGDIFANKNMGWTDKQEIEHSGTVSHFGLGHNELSK